MGHNNHYCFVHYRMRIWKAHDDLCIRYMVFLQWSSDWYSFHWRAHLVACQETIDKEMEGLNCVQTLY